MEKIKISEVLSEKEIWVLLKYQYLKFQLAKYLAFATFELLLGGILMVASYSVASPSWPNNLFYLSGLAAGAAMAHAIAVISILISGRGPRREMKRIKAKLQGKGIPWQQAYLNAGEITVKDADLLDQR